MTTSLKEKDVHGLYSVFFRVSHPFSLDDEAYVITHKHNTLYFCLGKSDLA